MSTDLSSLIPPPDMPEDLLRVIDRVRHQHLTYLPKGRLKTLAWLSIVNELEHRDGTIIEAGCGLGGSAIVLCASKNRERVLRIYDGFGMIPPPGENDGTDAHDRYEVIRSGHSEGIEGDTYYGYVSDLYECVRQTFAAFDLECEQSNVSLTKGLLRETLQIDRPVSLAHVDVDWYESVRVCLERIYPRLVLGGAIVIDDYNDWSGCRKAVDEFFKDKSSRFRFDESFGPLVAKLVR